MELGRGRVDVKGCVAALKDIGFDGWAIVELDRVVDPADRRRRAPTANRDFVVKQLGLALSSLSATCIARIANPDPCTISELPYR